MAFSFFEDILRDKPNVPGWASIDPSKIQQDTVAGNTATFAAAKDLASQYNDFMSQQVQKQLKTAVPEFQGLEAQAAANYGQQLKGQLSLSDAAASQRRSVARALGSGLNVSNLTARDLGLTQFGIQREAQGALPGFLGAMASIKKAPTMDPSSMFLTPTQRWQQTFANQENQWNTQWLSNQVAALPSGIAWALAKQGDEDIGSIQQLIGSYAGSAGKGAAAGGGSSY